MLHTDMIWLPTQQHQNIQLLQCNNSSLEYLIMVCFFYLQNALMTFEEDKMAKSLTTLRAMEKRCSSNLSWSPSFSSFQSMKSRLWGAQAGLSHQQTQNVSNHFFFQILRLICDMVSVATCLNIFMGLVLVHSQKY